VGAEIAGGASSTPSIESRCEPLGTENIIHFHGASSTFGEPIMLNSLVADVATR
jgi:hypothetical protein